MLLSPFESRPCGLSALPAARTNISGSHEGADARYGLADDQVLHQLKRGDRLSELKSLLGVGKRVLVGSHLATRRQPADAITSHAQDPRGVPERVARLEPIRFRHLAILQCDQTVLDHLERDLVLDLLDTEARRRLVLNDETLDLVVTDVARPDDRHVTPGLVADPFLLAVESPSVAFPFRGGR